jgi:hypothetical protein
MRVEARVEVAWLRSGYRLNATGEPASRLETRERFDWLLGAQRRVALLTAGSTRETFIVGQTHALSSATFVRNVKSPRQIAVAQSPTSPGSEPP